MQTRATCTKEICHFVTQTSVNLKAGKTGGRLPCLEKQVTPDSKRVHHDVLICTAMPETKRINLYRCHALDNLEQVLE